MTDGTRTRDIQDHNLELYQLSYGHHQNKASRRFRSDVNLIFTRSRKGVNAARLPRLEARAPRKLAIRAGQAKISVHRPDRRKIA